MKKILTRTAIAALPILLAAAPTLAQDAATVPCRSQVCMIRVDWSSSGGTPTDIDRRYGNAGELAPRVLEHLRAAGYRVDPDPVAAQLRIGIRPQMTSALCDRMAGTNTDRSCRTIGEARIEFMDVPDDIEVPGSIRVRGRCGNDERMTIERFSEFLAQTLDYELRRKAGEDVDRPSSRC